MTTQELDDAKKVVPGYLCVEVIQKLLCLSLSRARARSPSFVSFLLIWKTQLSQLYFCKYIKQAQFIPALQALI